MLDVCCGSGVFLRLAADRGAKPYGIDASEALVAVARSRVPEADARVGELERLPYADDTFDLVTGFTSFFAADMVAALREAGRVARPGAPVVIQVWGRPENCALEAMTRVVRRFMPKPPPDAPAPPELWRGARGDSGRHSPRSDHSRDERGLEFEVVQTGAPARS